MTKYPEKAGIVVVYVKNRQNANLNNIDFAVVKQKGSKQHPSELYSHSKGSREDNETVYQTAIRESIEELGPEVLTCSLLKKDGTTTPIKNITNITDMSQFKTIEIYGKSQSHKYGKVAIILYIAVTDKKFKLQTSTPQEIIGHKWINVMTLKNIKGNSTLITGIIETLKTLFTETSFKVGRRAIYIQPKLFTKNKFRVDKYNAEWCDYIEKTLDRSNPLISEPNVKRCLDAFVSAVVNLCVC